ncbi:MAG: hypothetical protein AAB307_01395, partial [Deltaproteobacteria bacterium]
MRVEVAGDIAKESGCLERAARVLAGRKALVVGLASTGIAASRFLKKCGAAVTATDVKPLSGLGDVSALIDMGVAVEAGVEEPAGALDSDIVVVSPGVPYDLPLLERA